MTNLEKWRIFTKHLVSPDSFIDLGYYFMIAVALQRRVWLGDMTFKPVFPNLYIVFVGHSGIGKGLVITEVSKFLRHHILPSKEVSNDKEKKAKYMFPFGADTTSFEKMVQSVSNSIRVIKDPRTSHIYSHTSVYFALEELSSLLRKNQEQIVKFLLNAYDAGDYNYETKHQGEDRIRRCCVSLLAGTTSDFMQESFDSRLMAQGFTARCIFVYEPINRFRKWEIPGLDSEQKQVEQELQEHIIALSRLYGQVTMTDEANEFLRSWWEDSEYKVANLSPKLQNYYAKKNITVKKLAMALHFSKTTDIDAQIDKNTCVRTLKILEAIEAQMHNALNFSPKNILSPVSRSILNYIKTNGKSTFKEVLIEFYDDLPNGDVGLMEVLRQLEYIGQITVEGASPNINIRAR